MGSSSPTCLLLKSMRSPYRPGHNVAMFISVCELGEVRHTFLHLLFCATFVTSAVAQQTAMGSDHELFVQTCSSCHSADMATQKHYSHETWQRVVANMRSRGAQGTDADFGRIMNYLTTLNTAPIKETSNAIQEWKSYGGDLANHRYSPLDQINASNFNNLKVAWRFDTANFGSSPEYKFESTPLMVKGVVYTTAGSRRDVVALDAATGEMLWMYREDEGKRAENAPRQLSGRGLAYWTDGLHDRILYVTPGYRLIALDASNGHRVSTFGSNGVVDLKQQDDQTINPLSGDIGLHAAPIVAGDTIIIGAAHRVGLIPRSKINTKGYVRGFDVRTGRRLWIFHTIPRKGEFGADTWQGDSASYTGNTGVWGQMSVDEELGLAYLPVELPTGDVYGGNRPGNGLFGETLVAVDLKTGRRRWHYQLVHHGMWDYDIPCAPVLVDITVDGKPIKALAQPTKQSILFVLDRETGRPVWPIVEQPVPQGDVPGETYSATQPIPTKPEAYGRNGFSNDDLINFTPQLHAEALKLASKYQIGPVYTPPVESKIDGKLGTLIIGFSLGGSNWPGGSYDPETHTFYVFSQALVDAAGLVPPEPNESDMRYVLGQATTGSEDTESDLSIHNMPLVHPPYGEISAIDLDHGTILWQVAHGETPDEVRTNPLLKGITIPRTGRLGIIGVLTTKSLLIAGEAGTFTNTAGVKGALLRAYYKATGKDAGAVYMPTGQTGSPMTYMLKGKQYLVVAVGGPGHPGELIAYSLPDEVAK